MKPVMQDAALVIPHAVVSRYFAVTMFYQPAAQDMRMSVSTNEAPHLQSSYLARMHHNGRWVSEWSLVAI